MIPVFDVARVIGWVKKILVIVFLWAAFKALVIGAIAVLVPYAIYKAFNLVAEKTVAFGNTIVAGQAWEGTYVELTGLAGWIADRVQLQACFQILASFVMIRYTLSFFKK